jgi:Na+/phosphate symporter
MDLTKEQFDKALKGLATKDDLKKLVTKDDLDERFEKQTRILMAYADNQVSGLAAMVADGFEEIKGLLDVRERVAQFEKEMRKIKEALQIR